MKLQIKSFIASNGERFCQIYDTDEPGFPLFYPTAYISRSIRLDATHGTQLVYLEAIKRVIEWEARQSCDLAVRFLQRDFLKPHEIDNLAQYLRQRRRGKSGNTVSTEKGNTYINYACAYLTWLANELITDADNVEVAHMIDTQKRRLDDKSNKKSGSKTAAMQKTVEKHLSTKARDQLVSLWQDPFAKLVRDTDKGSRLRNVVMLRILYETGMRRGELLSLKLKHLKESTGGAIACLTIERNHNDIYDNRVNQPVAKTVGRIVPISPELERQLFDYITEYRATLPRVGFDDEDFIFVNDRQGRGQAKPLSISTFDQSVRSFKSLFPALGLLHPHLLRHDWNFRFSSQADKAKMDKLDQRQVREELMGWRPESDMGAIYNKRYIQNMALEFGLQVAKDTQT